MKEIITFNPVVDEDELMIYELTQEQKIKILATHLLWSSLVFLIAMLI